MLLIRNRSNNQYYGKYFEKCVYSYIKQEDYETWNLENEEQIQQDAKKVGQYLLNLYGNNVEWIGNQTSNQNGDLMIANKIIELKYVSAGKGTYFNTSMAYLWDILGFNNYLIQLKESGIYDKLIKEGFIPNFKNKSPFTMAESKKIRYTCNAFEEFRSLESIERTKYIKSFYEFLIKNPKKIQQFAVDMINKGHKNIPDILIIYNYNQHKIKIISQEQIKDVIVNNNIFYTNGGITFPNFRVAISWQNGVGLHNPTLRVFLK